MGKDFELDFKYFGLLIYKYWLLLLLTSIVGLGVSFVYNYLATPIYTAKVSLIIWNQDIDDAIKLIKDEAKRKAITEANKVLLYNNLISQSMFIGQRLISDYQQLITSPQVKAHIDTILKEQNITQPLKYNFSCNSNKNSCIMDVEVKSPFPAVAEAAANALIEALSKEQERLLKVKYVQLMSPAKIPTVPSSPNKARNLILGLLVGLFCGGTCGFMIDYFDMTLKTPDDLKKLNLLPLGMVPLNAHIDDILKKRENPINKKDYSFIIDAVRLINTTIGFLRIDNPLKVISITSVLPGAGKSTNIILLGKIMGANQKRILIIDCDLRKPQLNKKLSLETGQGLIQFLLDEKGIKAIEFIQKDIFPGVDIMQNNLVPPNPTELLGSKRFKEMIEELKNDYDYILLDCPPSSGMADAMVLGSIVDAIIMVVESGRTRIKHLENILEQFDLLRDKVIGGIVNKFDFKKAENYNYNYSYNYNYNYQKDQE